MRQQQEFYNLLNGLGKTYSINAGETVWYKFTASDKMLLHSSSYQTFVFYYSDKGIGIPFINTISGISISDPADLTSPYVGGQISLTTGGWFDPGNNTRSLVVYNTATSSAWNFTIGSLGDSELDQYNLTIGNTYWFPVTCNFGWTPLTNGTHTVKVFRSGSWVTLTTSGRMDFVNISS